ncbi:YbjN domain-containing protein [Myxococcota bacterium]|nr:YbjN domain-containing protein [Myxococcota bacterium]
MCDVVSESPLFSVALSFFEEDEWEYQRSSGEVLLMQFRAEHALLRCVAQVEPTQEVFLFYSMLGVYVSEPKREKVALFLTRANYGMRVGNFEMDLEDGEVRFKTSFVASGAEATVEMVRRTVYYNLAMMDKYYVGLMRVVFADVTPEEAIHEIEG